MSFEAIIAVAVFGLVASITPGPNNTMLLASGINFGFVRTLPHMLGITFGFMFMLLAVGFGLSQLFVAYPVLHHILFVLSSVYLLYLAWKIATSEGNGDSGSSRSRPFTFMQSALFQWVNPKAWAMAVGATTSYVPHEQFAAALPIATIVIGLVNFPCITVWAGFGAGMKKYLTKAGHRRLFNYSLALLLVISVLMSAYEGYGKK